MGLTAATQQDYEGQLLALRPPGPAWPTEDDHLAAAAEECARVHNRAAALVAEADPRTTTELLSDWERVAGLPDACTGPLATLAERRAALVARLTSIGGQSRAYFIALAASLGYTITITEYRPYQVNDHVNDPLNSELWNFVWQVNAALDTVRRFNVKSGVNEPLATWGNALLECVIRRLAPAHTKVLFAYS